MINEIENHKGSDLILHRPERSAAAKSAIIKGYRRRNARYTIVCTIMASILFGLICTEMIYGKTIYSPSVIIGNILGKTDEGSFTIMTLRLPRMLTGLLCGLAFGMSGNTFQKILKNPLASPDIIGVSSGSSLAAVIAILIFHMSGAIVSVWAVVVGLGVALGIYALSHGHGFSHNRLILIGIGFQAFLSAAISWILLNTSACELNGALRWLSGSLNSATLDNLPVLAVVVAAAGIAILCLNKHLVTLQLGEEFAQTLGANPNLTRILLIIFALLLTAFATAAAGPIASVAFLAGPISTKLSGSAGKGNMVAAALTGAILVLAADLTGQYAFSVRYPVGVITGIIGAPYLLFLLISMNKKGSGI